MEFILGLGIHVIIALFFAVHALRTGRPIYWLIILFSFPGLGSIAYFFAEYLPANKLNRGVQQVSKSALKLLDPTRELREAEKAFDLTPTVQNRMRLASALDEAGQYAEASAQFDACLNGPFANDLELCFLAAKAKLHNNQALDAVALLTKIRDKQADFRPEQCCLLLATAYTASHNESLAQQEFIHAMNTFGSTDCLVEYALWASKTGNIETAKRLRADLDKSWQHWNNHTRTSYKAVFNEIDAVLATAKKKN